MSHMRRSHTSLLINKNRNIIPGKDYESLYMKHNLEVLGSQSSKI